MRVAFATPRQPSLRAGNQAYTAANSSAVPTKTIASPATARPRDSPSQTVVDAAKAENAALANIETTSMNAIVRMRPSAKARARTNDHHDAVTPAGRRRCRRARP